MEEQRGGARDEERGATRGREELRSNKQSTQTRQPATTAAACSPSQSLENDHPRRQVTLQKLTQTNQPTTKHYSSVSLSLPLVLPLKLTPLADNTTLAPSKTHSEVQQYPNQAQQHSNDQNKPARSVASSSSAFAHHSARAHHRSLAQQLLRELQAANEGYLHSLTRVLDTAYARRGPQKHALLRVSSPSHSLARLLY